MKMKEKSENCLQQLHLSIDTAHASEGQQKVGNF